MHVVVVVVVVVLSCLFVCFVLFCLCVFVFGLHFCFILFLSYKRLPTLCGGGERENKCERIASVVPGNELRTLSLLWQGSVAAHHGGCLTRQPVRAHR